jgi:hypothetical protein
MGEDQGESLRNLKQVKWRKLNGKSPLWRELTQTCAGDGWVPKDCGPCHARRDLFEQLQPFPTHAVLENREPSRVAARPCQARDETGTDWIDDLHE